MTKIAVYGDSYTTCNSKIAVNDVVIWTELLSEHFTVDNFGKSGSSLYYSYSRFVETHSKYTQIIFIITCPGRLELFYDNTITHISNLASAEHHLEGLDHTLFRPYVEAARYYYKYIFDYQKENLIHKLIINEISKIRPDAFIYKAFPYDKNQFTLSDISRLERGAWEMQKGEYYPHLDKRRAHLLQINHNKVFQHIYKDLTLNLKSTELNPKDFEQEYLYKELAKTFGPGR